MRRLDGTFLGAFGGLPKKLKRSGAHIRSRYESDLYQQDKKENCRVKGGVVRQLFLVKH